MTGALFTLTFVAALGCALNAGLFFIFSVCIMQALGRLETDEGISAMQSINRTIINPAFMAAFLGTALLCAVIITIAVLQWSDPEAAPGLGWAMAGGIVYLLAGIGVTLAVNVPMNNALDRAEPDSAEGATLWARYLDVWTKWNHVRSVGTLVATALFILALT
jgi:uncharacterized membrane protein